MGRVAVAIGPPNGGPRIVDRLAGGELSAACRPSEDSSGGPAGDGPSLPEPAGREEGDAFQCQDREEAELRLAELWFELPSQERERFGQCFSDLVLKALDLGTGEPQEVKA